MHALVLFVPVCLQYVSVLEKRKLKHPLLDIFSKCLQQTIPQNKSNEIKKLEIQICNISLSRSKVTQCSPIESAGY